jgi:hypothetical protein
VSSRLGSETSRRLYLLASELGKNRKTASILGGPSLEARIEGPLPGTADTTTSNLHDEAREKFHPFLSY